VGALSGAAFGNGAAFRKGGVTESTPVRTADHRQTCRLLTKREHSTPVVTMYAIEFTGEASKALVKMPRNVR
jgi:hypothetical protein